MAEVHRSGTIFERGVRFYEEERGIEPGRIEAIVLIAVEEAAALISPAYEDGSTEAEVEQRSLDWYGLSRRRDSFNGDW